MGKAELRAYVKKVADAAGKILELPPHLNITIRPHDWLNIIPETGEGGQTIDTELISLTFNPKLPYGKDALLKSLRETVFHELNHVYRWMTTDFDEHIMNSVVF